MPALNYRTRDCAYPEGKCPRGAAACAFRHATGQGGSSKAKGNIHVKSTGNGPVNVTQQQRQSTSAMAPARGVPKSAHTGGAVDSEGDDASDTMSLDSECIPPRMHCSQGERAFWVPGSRADVLLPLPPLHFVSLLPHVVASRLCA